MNFALNLRWGVVLFSFFWIFSFGSWFLLYNLGINSLPLQSEDVVPTVFTGISIVEEGTLYLDSYVEMMLSKYPHPDSVELTPYYLKKVNNRFLSAFPIMSALLSLPIFWLYSLFVTNYTWNDIYLLSHLSGSLIVSFSGLAFWYLIRRTFEFKLETSLFLSAIYLFGTINLSLISQSLWQHGTVQFFLILGLIFFYQKKLFFSFLFFSFAFITRPTALLVLGIFLLVLIWESFKEGELSIFFKKGIWKKYLSVFWGIVLPILFFVFYNQVYYLDVENQGYASQLTGSWLGRFPESWFGMWLSPSKGILIYSPVLVFFLVSVCLNFKRLSIVRICLGIVLLHTLILSFWKHWYGGYGFGYRMASDILPFMVLPIGFWIEVFYEKYLKPFLITLFVSIVIQISGLVFYDGIWHNAYDRGFRDTSWLWSISDSEAVFNFRRLLVKAGFLERACDKCEPRLPK